jgi:ATP-dependent RNA helicase DHX29
MEVSDLDSDLELDELVPAYLRIKGKLYKLDPGLVETTTRKQPKGAKAKKASTAQTQQSPAVRKLLSQLQQLASDALFDEREAEAQWPAKRNQIAQEQATQRQEQDHQHTNSDQEGAPTAQVPVVKPKPDSLQPAVESDEAEEEFDILGGMFSAVPNEPEPRQAESEDAGSENVILRDFGKSSGLTPRRLLEEAVRSR